jgi:hypothetical protein
MPQLSSLHNPFSLLITRVVAVVGKSEIYDGRHFVEWEEQIQPEIELNGRINSISDCPGLPMLSQTNSTNLDKIRGARAPAENSSI